MTVWVALSLVITFQFEKCKQENITWWRTISHAFVLLQTNQPRMAYWINVLSHIGICIPLHAHMQTTGTIAVLAVSRGDGGGGLWKLLFRCSVLTLLQLHCFPSQQPYPPRHHTDTRALEKFATALILYVDDMMKFWDTRVTVTGVLNILSKLAPGLDTHSLMLVSITRRLG